MRLLLALFYLWLGIASSIYAQTPSDTVLLKEVTVTGSNPGKYLPGGHQYSFESDSMTLLNLSQALETQIPVYFIQYGAPGQLSSINLRGLGAYRTSVLWQGLEINSFTLGQTDFSELIAGNGNRLSVKFGGVGPVFGNGALGGTVELDNNLSYARGHGLTLNANFGSYENRGINFNYRYSGKDWSSSTKLFRRSADNNFKYQVAGNTLRQQNAAFLHYGIAQDLKYRINSNQQLSLYFWYNDHFREVQPNKNDPNGEDVLDTRNTRVTLKWELATKRWSGKLQTGYTGDYQQFNRNQVTRLLRWYGSFDSEWQLKNLMVRAGANLNYLIPKVDAYQGNIKETRSELYTSALWTGIRRLSLGLSLRTPMLKEDIMALTPMISSKYLIFQNQDLAWSVNFQYGRSYRLPTLNDLYWVPGGNTGLKPEVSHNMEFGLDFLMKREKVNWSINLQGFRHDVDNWILWIPGGRSEDPSGTVTSFWYPENIREVLAYGIQYENSIEWDLPLEKLGTAFSVDGIFNKSLNKNTLSPTDRSKDKQLPYTPLHVINGTWSWKYSTWYVGTTMLYRSKRYVETNNELPPLDAYTLWNFTAGKKGHLGLFDWRLEIVVNNATGVVYETFENRAMPGRNYQLNLTLNFNYK